MNLHKRRRTDYSRHKDRQSHRGYTYEDPTNVVQIVTEGPQVVQERTL